MKRAVNSKAWAIGSQQRNGFHVRRIVWGLLMAREERRDGEEIRAAVIYVGPKRGRAALKSLKEQGIEANKIKNRPHPSNPRLLPNGEGVVCDQCGRQWNPAKGESPCCIECAVAWAEMMSLMRR